MMNKRILEWLLAWFIGVSIVMHAPAHAADAESQEKISTLIENYLDAYEAINRFEISDAAVAHFNSLFTPDIVYEIPGRGMRFEGEEFLSSDSIVGGSKRNPDFEVEALMVGDGVAFVRVLQEIERKTRDGEWKSVSATELLVFEFDGAKIKRVINYDLTP